jgi:NADPH2:quinone reductase
MRAIVCNALGDESTLSLAEVAPPPLLPGCVRIAVTAAGINFADGLMIAGRYQEKHQPPFIPGFEVAGTIVESASDVVGWPVGTRVMAVPGHGGFAEQVVARVTDVFRLPDSMDDVTAAGFPIAYGTAHHALTERAKLTAGQTLLVHGAAGGVGLTAVEVGHALGATVIATAGGPEKLAVAADHGADHGLDNRTADVPATVKALTGGRGVDVVFDPVGGPLFEASLRCTTAGGCLLVIGFAGGIVTQIPANILLVKNLSVIGYNWGAYRTLDPASLAASFAALFAWYEAGRLQPKTDSVLPLAEAATALRLIKDRKVIGKLVLRL